MVLYLGAHLCLLGVVFLVLVRPYGFGGCVRFCFDFFVVWWFVVGLAFGVCFV